MFNEIKGGVGIIDQTDVTRVHKNPVENSFWLNFSKAEEIQFKETQKEPRLGCITLLFDPGKRNHRSLFFKGEALEEFNRIREVLRSNKQG